MSGRIYHSPALCLTEEMFRVSRARRTLDLCLGGLGLVLATPVVLCAAVAILLADGRPVFFRQLRVGQDEKPFLFYKLRTMRAAGPGPDVTASGDSRVTAVGAVLRRLSIDELPQLWHVVRGQMTLVGPRPESESLAKRYPRACRAVLRARPGLTGPAQMAYQEEAAVVPDGWPDAETWYLEALVPLRTECDFEYLERPTFWRTLRYLGLTVLWVAGVAHERSVPEVIRRTPPRSDVSRDGRVDDR